MSDREHRDRIALQQLIWSYCHAIDRRDHVLLRSLYHDDAIDDHGAVFCGSPDAYVAWLPTMMANWQATAHTVTNMLFLFENDHAEGEIACTAWHRTADGTQNLIIRGRYLEQYRKRAGDWKFTRRALVLDRAEQHPAPITGAPGADDGVERGRPGLDDPCYRRLPLFLQRRVAQHELHTPQRTESRKCFDQAPANIVTNAQFRYAMIGSISPRERHSCAFTTPNR